MNGLLRGMFGLLLLNLMFAKGFISSQVSTTLSLPQQFALVKTIDTETSQNDDFVRDDERFLVRMAFEHKNDTCTCYCGGANWPPGATRCMAGYKFRCVDRGNDGTNCGWDAAKQGADQIPCDGGESCTQ